MWDLISSGNRGCGAISADVGIRRYGHEDTLFVAVSLIVNLIIIEVFIRINSYKFIIKFEADEINLCAFFMCCVVCDKSDILTFS